MVSHPVFVSPADKDVQIWRYMDFTKYVAMLQDRALFFSRADQFDDPFEGASTAANLTARGEWYSGPEWEDEKARAALESLPKIFEGSRKWTYVNCWHANEVESAAMWRLYARSNEAIAIQSTFRKLKEQLPEHTELGLVQYIDYDKDFIPDNNLFYRFMRKRKSFSHEREVRAIRQEPISDENTVKANEPNPELGLLVAMNLTQLIERVVVAPTAPPWFGNLVEAVTRRYDFRSPIVKSSLDQKPVY
jgi:hypothetical protein